MSNAQSTRDRILAAIPTNAADDEWAAPSAVADVLSLTVKTVRDHLNKAVKAGEAEVATDENGAKIYRAVAGPRAVPADVPADEPAESDADASVTPGAAVVPADPGSADSDELSAVLGGMQADRPGVVAALAAPAPVTKATCTASGCGAVIVKDGRSWKHERPELDDAHKATTRAVRAPAAEKLGTCTFNGCGAPVRKVGRSWEHTDKATAFAHDATTRAARPAGTGTQNRTFKPGELRDKVLAHLRTLPEGASLAPKDVATAVGSTASSANYALNLLAGTGEATVVNVDNRMQFRAS